MKTFQKIFAAGAITAFSFGFVLHAQERQEQPESSSTQAQQEIREQLQRSQQQQTQEAESQAQQRQQEFGARQRSQSQSSSQSSSQASRKMASELKGSELSTQSGEKLGEVEDIAVNLESGELSYILVKGEGGGSEWTPVPAQAINMRQEGGDTKLTVDIEQQRWEQAPKISEDEVAQLSQQQRGQQIYQFFGEDYQAQQQQRQFGSPERQSQREQQQQQQQSSQPGQESSSSQSSSSQSASPQSSSSQSSSGQSSQGQSSASQSPLERAQQQAAQQSSQAQEYGQQQRSASSAQSSQRSSAQSSQSSQQQGQTRLGSKLMDAKIKDQQQQELGEISDLILNLQEGRVDFVLIEAEDADGKFAVAPQAFQVTSEDEVSLNITQQDLQQAQPLRTAQIDQHARQARMMGSQARQNPEVFRYEESGSGTQFGSPDREREEKQEARAREEKKEEEARSSQP